MQQVADRIAVPGDDQVEGGLIAGRRGGGTSQQVAFGQLAFAVPLVFAGKGPFGISRALRPSMLFHKALGDGFAHAIVD